MNNQTKNGLALIAGALIGGAVVYLLKTPEGKKMTQKYVDQGMEIKDDLTQRATEVVDTAKSKVNEVLSNTSSKIEEGLGSVEEGVYKAIFFSIHSNFLVESKWKKKY